MYHAVYPLKLLRALVWCAALLCAPLSLALAAEARVPYVPTPQDVVDRMLEIAKVGPQDYLIDLGSGDGRIVVTAAKKHGARGFGVDINPVRIAEANENARSAGVTDRVAFYERDIFETDLASASVVTMYLLPRVNIDLRPRILELKPGTRVVSHDFDMGDWAADHHEEVEARDRYTGSKSMVYLWIVPARVEGAWRAQLTVRQKPVDYVIALRQRYQELAGTAQVGGRTVQISNGKIAGDTLSFEFTADVNGAPVKHVFNGRIYEDQMAGTADLNGAKLQAKLEWSAKK